MDFRNFFIPCVFEVKESISRSSTKLPCSGELENPGQLPVSEVLLKNRVAVQDSAIFTIEHLYRVMGRELDGVISLTFGDLERSDQGQLLKNRGSMRDSTIFTIGHLYKVMVRESDGVISLSFGDLERSDRGQLQKSRISVRVSAIVTIER